MALRVRSRGMSKVSRGEVNAADQRPTRTPKKECMLLNPDTTTFVPDRSENLVCT